jgi:putative ABC transport system permease protein
MPDWRDEVRAHLASLRLAPARESEIVDELTQHLDEHWRELIAGGVSEDEAARLTRAELRGRNLAAYMSSLRQSRIGTAPSDAAPAGRAFSGVTQDVRYALRTFVNQPGFAAAAVLTLALGIGATTAIFSVVHGVLLKPLPFPEPERLVSLVHRAPGANLPLVNHGPDTYLTYAEHQQAFEAIGAWEGDEVSISGRGEPEHVEALSVTATTLPILRVQPVLGRLFTTGDEVPGSPPHVILTHGYWQRRFGGAPDVVGQSLSIDGRPAQVVGVLPASFRFLDADPAVLLPMPLERVNGIQFDFQALGRLKPGVSIEAANADIARMIPMLHPAYEILQLQPVIRPLIDDAVGTIADTLWTLFAAVGLVLLIACANVANLFLVRAEARQQELATRAALGASSGRIARVLLSESLVLAGAAGGLGLVFATAGLGLLRAIAPMELPRTGEIGVTASVLAFAAGTSLIAGLAFGVVPVLRYGSPDPSALREGGRSSSDGVRRHRIRNTLVVAQIALALVLMIVSGLMVRTFVALRDVPPGFSNSQDVQTFRVAIPETLIEDRQHAVRVQHAILDRLSAVPGVSSAGMASSITMDGEDNLNSLHVEEFPVPEGQMPVLRRYKSLAPGFIETMGNRLVAGRAMTWAETYAQRPVVLVSETLAREYWKEPARAVGKRIKATRDAPWHEIVGVVGDERDDGLSRPATAIVYWPLLSESYEQRTMAFAVRSSRVGAPGFLAELRQAVWSVNPNVPLFSVRTLDDIRADSMARTSFVMVMLGIAAAVALLLGIVGMYAVIAYIAAQRTREVGIRVALGAQMADVRRLFLRHGFRLTAAGILIGVGLALVVSRLISAMLFGVGAADLATYAAVSGALGAVALLATYLPARRASRIDPIVALRVT